MALPPHPGSVNPRDPLATALGGTRRSRRALTPRPLDPPTPTAG